MPLEAGFAAILVEPIAPSPPMLAYKSYLSSVFLGNSE